jgi:hypothetical protein
LLLVSSLAFQTPVTLQVLEFSACLCTERHIGTQSLRKMLDGQSQVVLEGSQGNLLHSLGSAINSPRRQPFCTHSEGWGPISSSRFDLTPCFLDVIVAVVAVWGTLSGLGALWLLLRKRIPQPVSKNWHFYTKLVSHTDNEYPSRIAYRVNGR